jgi:DNA-binding MarR family transcriptional regulator
MKIGDELKTSKFQDEVHKAGLNIMFTAAWLHQQISARLKKYDLYHEQYNVLRILRGQNSKAICQKEILSRMINRSSNLTHIIAKLKKRKLITVAVSPRDRREYMIGLSAAGLKLLRRIDTDFQRNAQTFPHLREPEAKTLNALLDKFRDSD